MLSRVAGNIYWMSRYLERAENTARLVNVNSAVLLDLPKTSGITFGWESLIAITGTTKLFHEHYNEANERNVTRFLLTDEDHPSSILRSLESARENMRSTRDIIPTEAWEQLNNLYLDVKKAAPGLTKRNRYEFLKQVILGNQLIAGIATSNISRDAAYSFLRMGGYLERADMTTRILDVQSTNLLGKQQDEASSAPFYNIQWMSVLKSLTAYQMYRQHRRLRIKGAEVIKFLLQDREFPRALFFCLSVVENCLKTLPKNDTPLRSLARLQRQVQSADVNKLSYQGLHEFIDELQIGLGNVHDHISSTYFAVETSNAA